MLSMYFKYSKSFNCVLLSLAKGSEFSSPSGFNRWHWNNVGHALAHEGLWPFSSRWVYKKTRDRGKYKNKTQEIRNNTTKQDVEIVQCQNSYNENQGARKNNQTQNTEKNIIEKYLNTQSTNEFSESDKKRTNMKSTKKVTKEKNKKSLEKIQMLWSQYKIVEKKNPLQTADESLLISIRDGSASKKKSERKPRYPDWLPYSNIALV